VIVTAPAGAYAGIFIYSPTPALGNLIGSWAAQAGTDPFGNSYPQGLNVTVGSITGTTFTGTNFILNSSGFFFYNGAPALGTLSTSIAPTAGTDTFGNVYPAGIGLEQGGLVLFNQGSAPATISGAGIVYEDSSGRLRYKNNFGVDFVVDRCAFNLSNHTMNTQTLPTQMSAAMQYQAGEAVVGSEYEVQIDGTFQGPTGASSAFTFDIFKDGAAFVSGTAVTVGTVVVGTAQNTYAFTVKFRVVCNGTGVTANVNIVSEGTIAIKGANQGNSQTFCNLNGITVNGTMDTTVAHSFAIFCNWSSTTGTGHSAISYMTKFTRRNLWLCLPQLMSYLYCSGVMLTS
jgi:hypothetical protein